MTLSTSDIKRNRIIYLSITLFIFIFALIYEYFSHNIFSNYMTRAYLIPLVGFAIEELFIIFFRKRKKASSIAFQLLAGAVAWLTLGSIFQGVLEIYGTTNHLIAVFPIAGFSQLIASVVAVLASPSVSASSEESVMP